MIKEGRYAVKSAKLISDVAWTDIYNKLRYDRGIDGYLLNDIMNQIGHEWTAKKGNWPKRFAKVMKANGYVFENDYLSKIGKIARESCITSDAKELIVTRDTNWEPGTYGDYSSCYWGCRSAAHVILKESRSFALLLHGEEDGKSIGMARCWCTPYEHEDDEMYWVIYNCYCKNGEPINLVSFSRIVSDVFNIPYYRDVELTCCGMIEGPLWINNGKGYILGAQSAADISDVDLDYPLYCDDCGDECRGSAEYDGDRVLCDYCTDETYHCAHCETRLHEDNAHWPTDDECYCDDCLHELFLRCERCDTWEYKDDAVKVGGQWWCDYCASEYSAECDKCGELVDAEASWYLDYNDKYLCAKCKELHTCDCDNCGELTMKDDLTKTHNDDWVCDDCLERSYFVCDDCGGVFELEEQVDGTCLCSVCGEENSRSNVA